MDEWGGYYHLSQKTNLGLQLMPNAGAERDSKNLLPNNVYLHRDYGIPQQSPQMGFPGGGWMPLRDNRITQMFHSNTHNYATSTDGPVNHSLQMLQPLVPPKDENISDIDIPDNEKTESLKKRPQGRPRKAAKIKKPKKIPAPRDAGSSVSVRRGRSGMKSTSLVINGIDLDLSDMPTPVCSCTGVSQQCYRWGVGGWQSACCTTSVSMYPLPMSTKRKGTRIPGRKMSQGAFKKVLEKLAGEGYNRAIPIDLKSYWAKHGTNKFVTIR